MGIAYWERKMGLDNCDVLVVGAGIVGLAAALELRALSDSDPITVIDRSPFADGGSSRNAGFACFGSPLELLEDIDSHGEAAMCENVGRRLRGLERLRNVLGDEAIGYEATGSLEVAMPGDSRPATSPSEIARLNGLLAGVTGRAETFVAAGRTNGISGEALSVWHSPLEGMLQTDQLMLALERRAAEAGIVVRRGLDVTALRLGERAELDILPAFSPVESTFTLSPPKVLVAVNGMMGRLLGTADVVRQPNRVVVTEPIEGPLPDCPIHAEGGYLYARPLKGRQMLVGGGRHWGELPDGEREARLMDWLSRVVPAAHGAGIELAWTGMLGIGSSRTPRVESLGPNVHGAWRMGGMGVATGMAVGADLARLSRK